MAKQRTDTKEVMAAALRTCMETTSIDRISVKSITDACGLNRQTFYYHFRDIHALVKWLYLNDIRAALEQAVACEKWEESLQVLVMAIEEDHACHLSIYESASYYPRMRDEILAIFQESLLPMFKWRFDELGYDEGYREFLIRMYALTLFEFIERYARGTSYSTIESFIGNWLRTLEEQRLGAPLAGEQPASA